MWGRGRSWRGIQRFRWAKEIKMKRITDIEYEISDIGGEKD